MGAKNLVIFDYSGTLSLESVLFAEPARLEEELRRSGLYGLGVTTPDVFWNEIVDFTWERGSTTGIGYKRLLAERLVDLRKAFSNPAPKEVISAAAGRFVDRYLEASRIHDAWHSLLRRMAGNPDAVAVVATDHYAEATDAVIRHLRAAGVKAGTALDRFPTGAASFLVANSADLGAPKTDRRFWETIRAFPFLSEIGQLLLIDDFGYNEQARDRYGARRKVEERQEKTSSLLCEIFGIPVEVLPFLLDDPQRKEEGFATLVRRTAPRIEALCRL